MLSAKRTVVKTRERSNVTAIIIFPNIGTKGFKPRVDIEAYIEAFNANDFETYFQYYHPDVCVSEQCNVSPSRGLSKLTFV